MAHTNDAKIPEKTVINPSWEKMTFECFTETFEELKSNEEKLGFAINYMRNCLEHRSGPFFREFWESRKLCLPLFKESLSKEMKSRFWKDYIDLTREGRRLKGLLDEETAYAIEQIDLAICAIEEDVSSWENNHGKSLECEKMLAFPQIISLEQNREKYLKIQQELDLLNTFASKVHGMRKELLRQEMRIRQKNIFFNRLSVLGDRIFPVRRDFIKNQSELFLEDVSSFVNEHFSDKNFSIEKAKRQVFFFREEIKALQAFAKLLTLNTYAFTTTREQLSSCWDKLKGIEKELKKQMGELKGKSQENAQLVREKIEEFSQKIQAEPYEPVEALRKLNEIISFMREVELVRDDVRKLKEQIKDLKAPFEEKLDQEEKERKKKNEDQERKRKEHLEDYKQRVKQVFSDIDVLDAASTRERWEQLRHEFSSLKANKIEKHFLETELKTLRDLIADKERNALLLLSGEDLKVFESLEELLLQNKTRRNEIKMGIEELRKLQGSSGLDFEKAMDYSRQLAEEKERLEKVDESIKEIEQKIRNLKDMLTKM